MKLKELETKYEVYEVWEDREDLGLFRAPNVLSKETALARYGERKVVFFREKEQERRIEVEVA